ncbi:MAG: diguanylate cyclase [Anaerolineales bacterium]|nr:diguanylate cyclase [Anaerolineales bacterium]
MSVIDLAGLYLGLTLGLGAALTALAIWIGRRWRTRGGPSLVAYLSLVAAELLVDGAGFLSGSPAAAAAWGRLEWLFTALAPVALLLFVVEYSGRENWVWRPRRLAALLLIPLLTQVVVWFGPAAWLSGLAPEDFAALGPFWVPAGHASGYWTWAHALYGAGLLLIAVNYAGVIFLRAQGRYRQQALLLLGPLVGLAGVSALDVLGVLAWPWFEFAPWGLALVGGVLAWMFVRQMPLGLIPLTLVQAIDLAPDAVLILDPACQILFINPAAAAAFGIEAGAVSGRPSQAVLPLWPALLPLPAAGETRRAEIAGLAAGAARWWDSRMLGLTDQHRNLSGYLIFLRDVTDRKQAEQRLALQHSLARLLAEARVEAAPDEIMAEALRLVGQHLGWEVGEYWGADADQVELRYVAGWQAAGLQADLWAASARLLRVWRGEGLLGQVWAERQPRWSADVRAEPDFLRLAAAEEAGLRSALAFPLVTGDHSAGVLIFFGRTAQPPEATLLDVLAAAGAQLGQYLERWQAGQALRTRARQVALLNDITMAAIQPDDLPAMLQTLADRLGELLAADGCYLLLWDEARQLTIPMAAYGPMRATYRQTGRPLPDEPTVTAAVLRAGQPIVIDDVFNTPYLSQRIAHQFPTRSMLGLPLIADGQKLGAALVSFETPHTFSPAEVALGEQAARQVALAVAKARLLEAEREQRQVAEALREIGAVLSAHLKVEAILERLLELINAVVPYDAGTVMALEAGRAYVLQTRGYEQFGPEASAGVRQVAFDLVATPNLERLVATGRPLIVADTAAEPGWVTSDPSSAMRSWIGAPVLIGGQAAACLALSKQPPGFYQAFHAERLSSFAAQTAIALENARLFQAAVDAAHRRELLHLASQAISAATTDLAQLAAAIHRAAGQLLPVDALHIVLVTAATGETEAIYPATSDPRWPGARLAGRAITQGGSLRIDSFQQFLADEYPAEDHSQAAARSGLAVSMRVQDRITGALCVLTARPRAYSADDQQLFELLAAQAAVAIENAQLLARVQQLAIVDGLTGLYNRRHFFALASREWERARRTAGVLAVLMIDLDHFKLVNDSYGHAVGDLVLRQVAALCREALRQVDVIARYGGEELIALLPDTPLTEARRAAERLRRQVAAASFPSPHGGLAQTISIGVAARHGPTDAESLDDLIDQADQALYAAKQQGRNQVISAWPATD